MKAKFDSALPGLISGILLGVTTIGHGPVYHVHWAIFFGFVPLWIYWLEEKSARRIFFAGWIAQFAFTLVAFHWLAYTVNEFSHLGAVASTLVMLLYCALANLQFPIAGVLWHWIFHREKYSLPTQIAALALLTALAERLGTMIFHWNFGYAWLYMGWPGVQVAELVGFRWLCTFSICMNGLLLLGWKNRSWRSFGAAALAFALMNFLGLWLQKRLPPPDSSARVLLIQPNIGNRDKEKLDHENDFREVALQRYFDLTDLALKQSGALPDFAIWPENAFPGVIADIQLTFGLTPKLKAYLYSRKLNLLTGSYGFSEEGKTTNGLFAIDSAGMLASRPYEKQILLPFGEYIPGAETFPVLKKLLPDVRDYGRGKETVVLELRGRKIGAQICYEGLFDSLSRDIANHGAELIVNITNDSWYGTWMEPWQHFYITMAKAIETRRPLIRDTNTGISAVILANGELSPLSPMGKEWFQMIEVPYRKNPPATLFMGWGFWFDWFFLATGLLALLFKGRGPRLLATRE